MAVWIGGRMAEWSVGRILDTLANICSEYIQDQSESKSTMEKMLQGLRQNQTMIEAVLFVSGQAQIQDQNPLNNFIWQLRDSFAEAANFLVEFEYTNHEEQLTENKKKRKVGLIKSCLSESSSKICQVGKSVLKIDPKRLEEVVQKLDKISANVGLLYFAVLTYTNVVQLKQDFELFKTSFEVDYRSQRELESCHGGSGVRLGSRCWSAGETSRRGKQVTSSFSSLHFISTPAQAMQRGRPQTKPKTLETVSLPKSDLIGRCNDKKFILQWLLKQPSYEEYQPQIAATTLHNNVSLLSIVGHGGMGKTTLVQHVYEDEMTKEFDLKMWVCVSRNFDVKKVMADMLESLKKRKPDLESLDALQGSLKSAVQSKKFLLVLDDISDEEEEKDKRKWENVLAPLAYGSLGSKILVTTRMDSAAAMITKVIKKRKEILKLKGLEEDECLQLLGTHAFADVENLDDFKKLRSIAGEMVKKILGSPLAAKVIGGVLNSNLDERHWRRVLNNDIGSTELVQIGILPLLRLCYSFLSKPLQNCFAFCGIFPKYHVFDKDDLIRIWIKLGFIQPTDIQGETMENVGERYFNILVQKSFFDELYFGKYYTMHDLLQEFARSIFTQKDFRVLSADARFG